MLKNLWKSLRQSGQHRDHISKQKKSPTFRKLNTRMYFKNYTP
jgi:hypothetical protein